MAVYSRLDVEIQRPPRNCSCREQLSSGSGGASPQQSTICPDVAVGVAMVGTAQSAAMSVDGGNTVNRRLPECYDPRVRRMLLGGSIAPDDSGMT